MGLATINYWKASSASESASFQYVARLSRPFPHPLSVALMFYSFRQRLITGVRTIIRPCTKIHIWLQRARACKVILVSPTVDIASDICNYRSALYIMAVWPDKKHNLAQQPNVKTVPIV